MTRSGACALALLVACWSCTPDGPLPARVDPWRLRILAAEDARPQAGPELATLLEATALPDPQLRGLAVRAVGRLESPALVGDISRHLEDPDASVRAASVRALAQSVHRGDGSAVLGVLLDRVAEEEDPSARAALAESLGRLRLAAADRPEVERALLVLARDPGGAASSPPETLLGVALGFESLVRRAPDAGLAPGAAGLLVQLLEYRRTDAADLTAGRVRALALAALGTARRAGPERIAEALRDPAPEVRRTAVRFLGAVLPSRRPELIRSALADPAVRVRVEAVRHLASVPAADAASCALLLEAAGDREPAVRAAAFAALARPCPQTGAQRHALAEAAGGATLTGGPAQVASRALLALAALDPDAAEELLPLHAGHPSPFVRAWAARAATSLGRSATLVTLAEDPDANVRAAALEGLFTLEGHTVDPLLIRHLESGYPQLTLAAADLLEGSALGVRVATAALRAFERMSAAERETWRDPRRGLLERVAELGDSSLAARLAPYLRDHDPLVAGDVAAILTAWTGRPHEADPQPLPRLPLPTPAELAELGRVAVVLHMAGGDTLVIEPLPGVAPLNAFRFVRLAREGYYDRLTFHRWEPNFVIQGGSPGANEYAGDGPYTRDEVGAHHWRGTVGLSTRGRDTGDAQIFVNLVHNLSLDHEYTVFGRVVAGLDVVDGILDGAVIERAEVRERR